MFFFFNFIVLVLPFIFLPSNTFQFEPLKVILFEITILIILIVFFFKNQQKIKINKYLFFITAGFVILSIVDLIFLATPNSFFGNIFRLQGILLLWFLFSFSILSSIIKIKEVKIKWFLICLTLESILSLIIGATLDGRIVGTIGEPNALASYVVFLSAFILFTSSGNNKVVKISTILIGGIIILLSGSRSGLVAFFIEIMAFSLLRFMKMSLGKTILIGLFLMISSLGLPFIDKTTSLLEDRKEIWKVAYSAGLTKPIIGNGYGNIETAINKTAVKENSPIQYIYVDSSHNLILDWWVEGGIIGLIIIMSIIFSTIYNYYHKRKIAYLFAFICITTTMLFNPASIVGLTEFFWLAGLSFQNQL